MSFDPPPEKYVVSTAGASVSAPMNLVANAEEVPVVDAVPVIAGRRVDDRGVAVELEQPEVVDRACTGRKKHEDDRDDADDPQAHQCRTAARRGLPTTALRS